MKITWGRVGALGGALVLGIMPIASANALGAGNIDPGKKGSLTVYKHVPGSATTGKVTDTSDTLDSEKVKDVEFTLYPITNKPLTGDNANDNWAFLKNIEATELANACAATPTLTGLEFGSAKKMPKTDSDGKATIANLDVQAYLVCETDAPAKVVSKAAPFIVTIPFPDDGADGTKNWVYDVTVYPKNAIGGIVKTIESQPAGSYGLGSIVKFPVTTDVPSILAGNQFQYYVVEDELDSRLSEVGVVDVKLDGTALTKETDYKVVISGQKVQVQFTQAGLAQLKTNGGKKVVTTFQGKVTSLTLADKTAGTIPNTAKVYVKDAPGKEPPSVPPPPDEPGIPSDEVETHWGNAKILKRDATNQQVLAGATFQVYAAKDPYATACTTEKAVGAAPISVNGSDTFTSNDDGVVSIDGLFVSDSVNNPGKDSTYRCYVLVETKAPDGYVLPADPAQALKVTVGETTNGNYDLTVNNTKQEVPELPLTGAAGQMMLGAAGLIAVAAAGGLYLARRKAVTA